MPNKLNGSKRTDVSANKHESAFKATMRVVNNGSQPNENIFPPFEQQSTQASPDTWQVQTEQICNFMSLRRILNHDTGIEQDVGNVKHETVPRGDRTQASSNIAFPPHTQHHDQEERSTREKGYSPTKLSFRRSCGKHSTSESTKTQLPKTPDRSPSVQSASRKRSWNQGQISSDSKSHPQPAYSWFCSVFEDYRAQLGLLEQKNIRNNAIGCVRIKNRVNTINEGRTPSSIAEGWQGTDANSVLVQAEQQQSLQEREVQYSELLELLRFMANEDAITVLSRLAAGINVGTIINQLRTGDLRKQLFLIPETIRRFEFPYVTGMPDHLFIADNPYMDSLLYHAIFSHSNGGSSEATQANNESTSRHVLRTLRSAKEEINHQVSYVMPYNIGHMVDPRLEKIKASSWTRVISDNSLFHRLISAYFQYLHASGPFVHVDLFLDDMVANCHTFCSPLLVNAMLAIACQSCLDLTDRSNIWLPSSLTYRFMVEAKRLWDIESFKTPQITTIQAALILSYFSTINSMDPISVYYRKWAVERGKDMGLFEYETKNISTRMARARIFTAWAIFSYQAFYARIFYHRPDLEQPPQTPLPDARSNPRWYGEIWVQYPHSKEILPVHLGLKFQAEAVLHTIMNKFNWLLFSPHKSQMITIIDIIMLKRQLDIWVETLPDPLQSTKLIFPCQLSLHMEYLHFHIDLMQLIIDLHHSSNPMVSDLLSGITPQSVIKKCQIMLETVIRLYYARHNFQLNDPWIIHALAFLGNLAVAKLKENSSTENFDTRAYQSTIILSAQGMRMQSMNIHVGRLINLQLEGTMRPQELQLVHAYCQAERIAESDQALIEDNAQSLWPVPGLSTITADPEQSRLKNIVKTTTQEAERE